MIQRTQQRSQLMQIIRSFFMAQDFTEVDTPVAIAAPAPELYIDAPEVVFYTQDNPPIEVRRFLQTSPELAMKRLLAAGMARIFQIAVVFRDGDFGPQHCPEFRLLEWYRRDASWEMLLDDCEQLLYLTCMALNGTTNIVYQGRPYCVEPPFLRMSVDSAFQTYAGFSILDNLQYEDLLQQLSKRHIYHSASDSWDDLFHRVFVQYIEPKLQAYNKPLFLTHYPAPLCSLARLCPTDPRTAERFELYGGPLELANGFGELTDSNLQRTRFIAEQARRASCGKRVYPLDEDFLAALDNLPPSSGIAMGVERLLMFLTNAACIDDVSSITWHQRQTVC